MLNDPPKNPEDRENPPANASPTYRRVCGAELELQYVYLKALCVVPVDVPAAEPGEVFDMLRCVLEAGHPCEHHGIGRSLPMRHPGEVWASWLGGRQPTALLRLGDCPDTDPADRDNACVLFDGHPGAHSWALSDPDEEEL